MANGCIVRAGLLLGVHRAPDFRIRKLEILELAHQLHVENNLSNKPRDQKRDQRFASVYNFLLSKYDDAKAGGGGNDGELDRTHVADIEKEVDLHPGSIASHQRVQRFSTAKNCKLNVNEQAWVLAAMGKNTVTGTPGDVPIKSIRNLLAHPRCLGKVLHNSAITAYMRIACSCTGAIEKIAEAVKPHFDGMRRVISRAARYVIRKLHWFTFLRQPEGFSHLNLIMAPQVQPLAVVLFSFTTV